MRRRLEKLLNSVELPNPFDIQKFCDRISELRGRPLLLNSIPGIAGAEAPCGVWIATETTDHIFHEAATSPLHQNHIVLHEISHMLLGHTSILSGLQPPGARLFADIDPQTVASVLNRAAYGTADEREAERFAGLIARRADLSGRSNHSDRTADDPVLQRLDDALSDL
jgi:hypothetical protein